MSAESGYRRREKLNYKQKNLIGRYVINLIHKYQAKKMTLSLLGYAPEAGQELILTHHSSNESFNQNCGPNPCADCVGTYSKAPFLSDDGRSFIVEQKTSDGRLKQFSLLTKLAGQDWQPTGWKINSSQNK